jgi:uncharacterized membrane protein
MKVTKALKRSVVHACLAAAFAAGLSMSASALALDEDETKNNTPSGQPLAIGADGSVTVTGVIGVVSGPAVPDVDYYSFDFQANADGSCVNATFNIDNAMHDDFTGVDTIIAVFGPEVDADGTRNPLATLSEVDDAPDIDAGSASTSDARIDNLCLTESGRYVVGVSSFPRAFVDVNTLASSDVSSMNPNGAYTLVISGLPPTIEQPPEPAPQPPTKVSIRIKPRHLERYWDERYREKGSVAVAILSSATFDARQINPQSLRFGKTGAENSLVRCHKREPDVNHDRRRDLLCHFDSTKTDFEVGDTEGKLTGLTVDGAPFEGHGWLKIVPQHKRPHYYFYHRHHYGHEHERTRIGRW